VQAKIRNFLSSLCLRYVLELHHEHFQELARLAEANYEEKPHDQSLNAVFRHFLDSLPENLYKP
jgi:hypothetical protein